MDFTPSKRKRCSMGPEASLAFSLQALFERHEAYAADAEKERTRLELEVVRLEGVNKQLEDNNVQLKKENQELHIKFVKAKQSQTETDKFTPGEVGPIQQIRRLELQVEELEKKQEKLQAALNKALDQERIVVKDWMNTKVEVDRLRKQLKPKDADTRTSSLPEDAPSSRSSSQSTVDDANFSSRNASTSTTTSVDDSTLQSTLTKQHDVLHLLQSQVEDLRNQLLTEQNLALINRQPSSSAITSPTQELTLDLSSKQTQEVHVHHHYHAGSNSNTLSSRPQPLLRSKTQAVRTRKRPMLSLERSISTRRRSSLQVIPDDPMLEQAAAVQSAALLLPFSQRFRSRPSSNDSTPRPQRLASGYSYKSSHGSSPQSVQSTVFEDCWKTELEDDQSRPTTPSSSIVWTPSVHEEDIEDETTLCSKIVSEVILPYDVSEEGDYFSAETPVILRSPRISQKQLATSDAPFIPPSTSIPEEIDQKSQIRELPASLQIPRQRPLRSAASLALLRPSTDTTSTSTSARPHPPRRLQSLPSTQSAPSLITPSTSITITTVNAAATLSSSATPATSTPADTTSTARSSKIGGLGWLPKWRSSSTNDVAASKLLSILHDDVTKHANSNQVQPQPSNSMTNEPRSDPSMLRDITSANTKPATIPATQHKQPPQPRAAGVNQPGGLALFLQQAQMLALAEEGAKHTPSPLRSVSGPAAFQSLQPQTIMTKRQLPSKNSTKSMRLEDSDLDEDALAECLAEGVRTPRLPHLRRSSSDQCGNEDNEKERNENGAITDLTFFPRVQGDADWASFVSGSGSGSAKSTPLATSSKFSAPALPQAMAPSASVAKRNNKSDHANDKDKNDGGSGEKKKEKQEKEKEVVVRNRSLKVTRKSGWRSLSGGVALGR